MKNLKHLGLLCLLLISSAIGLTSCAGAQTAEEAQANAQSNDCCGRSNANLFVVTAVTQISNQPMITAKQVPTSNEGDEVNFFSNDFHVGDTLYLQAKEKVLISETSYE
jgi:hypothetical protein